MTVGRGMVRVSLYGCSHKPKFSAFSCPLVNDWLTCLICKRPRQVTRVEYENAHTRVECRGRECQWVIAESSRSTKVMKNLARRHADALGHLVVIISHGVEYPIKPRDSYTQPVLDVAFFE